MMRTGALVDHVFSELNKSEETAMASKSVWRPLHVCSMVMGALPSYYSLIGPSDVVPSR